jgi:hypothetical protein
MPFKIKNKRIIYDLPDIYHNNRFYKLFDKYKKKWLFNFILILKISIVIVNNNNLVHVRSFKLIINNFIKYTFACCIWITLLSFQYRFTTLPCLIQYWPLIINYLFKYHWRKIEIFYSVIRLKWNMYLSCFIFLEKSRKFRIKKFYN